MGYAVGLAYSIVVVDMGPWQIRTGMVASARNKVWNWLVNHNNANDITLGESGG